MIFTHASSVGESENTTFQLHHVNENAEIIAFCVDEAGTHIFCTSQARDFLGNLSSTNFIHLFLGWHMPCECCFGNFGLNL